MPALSTPLLDLAALLKPLVEHTEAELQALGILPGAPHTIPQALHDAPPPHVCGLDCHIPQDSYAEHDFPASPRNYTHHAPGRAIDTWVLHVTESSRASSACNWFADPAAQCSAQKIIDTTGDVFRCVGHDDIAWHAGNGVCNARSVGVEHSGYTDKRLTQDQLESSAQELAAFARARSLVPTRPTAPLINAYVVPAGQLFVIEHREVADAAHPGRFGGAGGHEDCGAGLVWPAYMARVAELIQ